MNQSPFHRRGFGADFVTEAPEARSEEALAELLLATRRQAWVMAFGACVGLAGALFHYATSPKTYEAAATLLIEEQRTELEQEISSALPTSRNDTSMMNEMQILASLQVASDVVEDLNLSENAAFLNPPSSLLSQWVTGAKDAVRALIPEAEPEGSPGQVDADAAADRAQMQTAQRLRTNTTFHRVGRSFVVEIWYASHDPALAADIVNAYADAYISDGIRETVQSAEERARWMDARLNDLRAEAQAAAEAAENFRLDVGVADRQGLRELEQQSEALNDLVFRFENRYRELALESSFPVSSGRILSRALPPRDPSAPRATHTVAAGLFLGLILGLAIAVWREARETGFRTGRDVTRGLGLPFLGYVPARRRGGLRRLFAWPFDRRRPSGRRARKTTPRDEALPQRHIADPHFAPVEPPARSTTANPQLAVADSSFAQAIRGVFAALDPKQGGQSGRLIAIGAMTAREGSSAIAMELAHQSASSGRRCLLIDADLAGQGLTGQIGLSHLPGALDVLDGTVGLDMALVRNHMDDLDILPVGASAEGALTIAYLSEFGELITDLAEGYDDVVIALPPLLNTPEARTLVRLVDTMILAIAWGRTSRRLITSVLETDAYLRQRNTGVVLSGVNLRRLSRYGVTRPWQTGRFSGRVWAKTP